MLAKPSYKLEQGDEVWPHLQLLLSPLCLPAVTETFKAPLSVEHCPLPVLAQRDTQILLGLQEWSGKVPGHLPNLVLLLRDHCLWAAEPLACSLAARQARRKREWDGAQLFFKVVLLFSTSETERAGESWQELRDDPSYVRQVATSSFVEGTWFLSATSAGPELLLCMLMEMALVPEVD